MSNPFYREKKVLVCGGDGFIGSHLTLSLLNSGAIVSVVGQKRKCKLEKHSKLNYISKNLLDVNNCKKIVKNIDYVFQLAGTAGGIDFNNKHHASLFSTNSLINLNMLKAATNSSVKRFLFASSVVVYPKSSKPLVESEGFKYEPEFTNFGYSWSKRVGELQCKMFAKEFDLKVSIVRLDNTYGPNDNFNPNQSRVIPSLIRKAFKEKTIVVWGSGKQKRSFVFVDDVVDGMLIALKKYPKPDPLNIGSGKSVSIKTLVNVITKLSGKKSKIIFDDSKLEGTPIRVLDIKKAKKIINYEPKWKLKDGLKYTIDWYEKHS